MEAGGCLRRARGPGGDEDDGRVVRRGAPGRRWQLVRGAGAVEAPAQEVVGHHVAGEREHAQAGAAAEHLGRNAERILTVAAGLVEERCGAGTLGDRGELAGRGAVVDSHVHDAVRPRRRHGHHVLAAVADRAHDPVAGANAGVRVHGGQPAGGALQVREGEPVVAADQRLPLGPATPGGFELPAEGRRLFGVHGRSRLLGVLRHSQHPPAQPARSSPGLRDGLREGCSG